MNNSLIAVLCTVVGISAFAGAGTVALDNTPLRGGSEEGRFYRDGVFLSGPAYLAQLYAGIESDRLVKVGEPTAFLTGDMAGYFSGGSVAIPFIQGSIMAFVQVRAWEAENGATFEEAALSGHWSGISSILHVLTGNPWSTPPSPPASLFGLKYPGDPVIVQSPADRNIRMGESAALEIVASGGVQLRYQWYQGESGNLAKPVTDATNAVFSASPAATTTYWVRASTSAGATDSAAATVTVIPANAVLLNLRLEQHVPVVTVETPASGQFQLLFSGNVVSPTWDTLTNVMLTTNRLTIVDAAGSNALVRFYRGVILP